jgi:PhoH-like ATPase
MSQINDGSQRSGEPKQSKTFVLDTNVFIHRPDALFSFKDSEVVIPLWVLEELDKLKTFSDEKGRNARRAIRLMDEAGTHGNLAEGVKLENGATLRVALSHSSTMPRDLMVDKVDNKIILAALDLQQQGKRVFFVSKDINARIKATALGIKSVDYEKQKVNADKLYQGFTNMDCTPDTIATLRDSGVLPWSDQMAPNHFFLFNLKSREGLEAQTELARYDPAAACLRRVPDDLPAVAGIQALNQQQRMAFDLLLDPSVALVSLIGKAGTGKTLLAIAAGLKQTIEDKTYNRVLVSRPVIPMGKDIGYLPGSKGEKLAHWMMPLFDNLEYILSVYKKPTARTAEQLVNSKIIELEALAYIRGRSLPQQFIIIDEAQNLTPHEVKTIVSRAGEGSKVVLTGDPYQIDSPYLDAGSNGLSYLVEAFKGQRIAGHVSLSHTERSPLAELAATLL